MTSPLEKEFAYYLANQAKIVKLYNGKFVVIKGEKVIGAYDDELHALKTTEKDHPKGTFLIQHAAPGDTEYTQTFHSRVAFS